MVQEGKKQTKKHKAQQTRLQQQQQKTHSRAKQGETLHE